MMTFKLIRQNQHWL